MNEPVKVGDTVKPIQVYQVQKYCTQKHCGVIWTGNSFSPPVEGEAPRMGTCDKCLDEIEARKQGLIVPARRTEPAQVELLPPLEVGDAWEPEVLPFRGRAK